MFKKRRRFPGRAFFILLLIVTMVGGYFIVDRNLRPAIVTIAESRANLLVNDIVSEVVQRKVAEERIQYQDLVNIHKDNNGRIVMMQANTVRINQMATDITLEIDKALRKVENEHLKISLGQALGSHFLAHYGPQLSIDILPVGSINVSVTDDFDATGINQTRHRIALDLKTKIKVAIPLYDNNIVVHTVVPLTESIIVGDVPETWVNVPGGLLGGIDALKQ